MGTKQSKPLLDQNTTIKKIDTLDELANSINNTQKVITEVQSELTNRPSPFSKSSYFSKVDKKLSYDLSSLASVVTFFDRDSPFSKYILPLDIPKRLSEIVSLLKECVDWYVKLVEFGNQTKITKSIKDSADDLVEIKKGLDNCHQLITQSISSMTRDISSVVPQFINMREYEKHIRNKFIAGGTSLFFIGCVLIATGALLSPLTGGLSLLEIPVGVALIVGGGAACTLSVAPLVKAYLKDKEKDKINEFIEKLMETRSLVESCKYNSLELKSSIGLREIFVETLLQLESPFACCIETCGNSDVDRDMVYIVNGAKLSYYCRGCIERHIDKYHTDPKTKEEITKKNLNTLRPHMKKGFDSYSEKKRMLMSEIIEEMG